jgi:hypothetical protein
MRFTSTGAKRMNRKSSSHKFFRFMSAMSAGGFALGMLLLSTGRGFGPCGPVDAVSAVGFLLLLLSCVGGLIFVLPWLIVYVMFVPMHNDS